MNDEIYRSRYLSKIVGKQSALNLDSAEKAEQEMRPLLKIKDSLDA